MLPYSIIIKLKQEGTWALDRSLESLLTGEDVHHRIRISFSNTLSIFGITQIIT